MNKTEKIFTLKEIKDAICCCPKHTVNIKTPPEIDGMLDEQIITIEIKMFLYKLLN